LTDCLKWKSKEGGKRLLVKKSLSTHKAAKGEGAKIFDAAVFWAEDS
jgi:hypothetical protein